jgi:RNA polymerase sigma factor (sigma-70 family)
MAQMAAQNNNIIQTIGEYGKQLFGFIRGRVNSEEDAEDILQDVWQQFINLPEKGAIESVSGWLHRVARNKIIDRARKKKTAQLDELYNEDDEFHFAIPGIMIADNVSPEMEHLKQLFWEELFAALEELPENQRNAFVKNELEDKTLKEIADEEGENLKTIISRKRYAVLHLRERLEYLYDEFLTD